MDKPAGRADRREALSRQPHILTFLLFREKREVFLMEKPKQPPIPGSGLIRVGGILLLICAALGVLIGPLSIVGGTTLASPEMAAFLPAGQGAAMADSAIRSGIVMTVTSAVSLVGGILAVRFHAKPARRKLCLIVSIVLMVSQLAGETVLALNGEFDLVSAAIRLVFPLLIFAGSLQLPAAQASVSGEAG